MPHDAQARTRNDGRPSGKGLSCKPSVRGRQRLLPAISTWRSSQPNHADRARSFWTWLATTLLVGGLALPGCQKMGDDGATASSEPMPVAQAPAESEYPSLQTVPPRPQLSYTVQQQRQIVDALVADRENARYTGQVVRHRSGLSSLPPPPTPPAPAAPIDLEPAVAAPAPEPRLGDQETLIDFLGALLFGTADAEPAPVAAGEPEVVRSAAPQAPSDRPEGDVPAAGAGDPPADGTTHPAPVPPARSAIAARLAAGPGVIDALVDETVPQAPLPPGQPALAARIAAAEQIEALAAAPVPAPRPVTARPAQATPTASLPAPPPLKPLVPVSAPMPPRPAEKPDDRSAAAFGSRQPGATPAGVLVPVA